MDIAYLKDLLLLEQKLNEEQGYKNKALSVTVGGLAGWCVVKRALEHPEDAKKLSLLLQKRNKAVIFDPLETMKMFVAEDGKMANQEQLVEQALVSDRIIQARKINTFAVYKVLQEILPEKLRPEHYITLMTTGFLHSPSIYKLDRMVAYIEVDLRSIILALLRYIEKGGDVSKLDPYNMTELIKVMGKEEWNYRFSYLNVKSLSDVSLLNLIESVTQKNAKQIYLKKLGLSELEEHKLDETPNIGYPEKESQKKIGIEKKLIKVDSAVGVIADKIRNVSSSVEVKGGKILLTIKAHHFKYLVTKGVYEAVVPLNLGQDVVLERGFEAVAFQSEVYTLKLTKESDNVYLLEELKAHNTAKNTELLKTLLKFKFLDDKLELMTPTKEDVAEEGMSASWLNCCVLGVVAMLSLIIYKRKKSVG